jgi:uncharacterized protein (TIGR03435 family)
MRTSALFSLALLTASAALGQKFEVISIKPNDSNSTNESDGNSGGRFHATNITLRALIARAYGMPQGQVIGPDWLDTVRFDIIAKFPETFVLSVANLPAVQEMHRNMLADRFKLEAHPETRSLPAYALVVDKKGAKLGDPREGCSASRSNNYGTFIGTCITMKSFAEFVSWYADLPVVDMTGINGSYDVNLKWTVERRRPDAGDSMVGTTLDIALQEQLGLKLERRKAPIDVLIVDRVEKPTEN